jgi:hypothetical protein
LNNSIRKRQFSLIIKKELGMWYMSIISALQSLRHEDGKFKASLGYIAKPHLKEYT